MASLRHGVEEPGDVQDIRLVVDTIPTLAWSAAPDGSAEFFNQRWLDYTGLLAKQALASGWEAAIHPEDLPRILEVFRKALKSTKPYKMEVSLLSLSNDSLGKMVDIAGFLSATILFAITRATLFAGMRQGRISRTASRPRRGCVTRTLR
jgi:PAS domain-containing protein